MSRQDENHPWAVGSARVSRDGVRRVRHSADDLTAILAAVATASYGEVAVAYSVTRGAVAGIVDRARRAGLAIEASGLLRERPKAVPRVVPPPKAKSPPPLVRRVDVAPPVPKGTPTPVPPVAAFGSAVTILSVGRYQCRALDDERHCCCQPTWRSTSWCHDHALAFLPGMRRVA